jgi:CubicO group peptidase (beta-lactamase class C family)
VLEPHGGLLFPELSLSAGPGPGISADAASRPQLAVADKLVRWAPIRIPGSSGRLAVADGLTAAGLARVHAAAEQHVGDDRVPGLVALVARGEQVHVEALGKLAVGGGPVARDSIFRISSTTKPITGAATLALAAEGLLALDEPVDRLLPELSGRRVLRRMDGPLDDTVPAARAITARDLLTFTFGFGMAMEMFTAARPWPVVEAAEALQLATIGPPDPQLQPDPDTWIAGLGTLPLLAQPGERWFYNTGASVLGVLLARAAGEPLARVLRSRIFAPLGMRDTAFFTTATERLATGYRPTPGGLVVSDPPDGAWSRPPAFGDAAAGLVSTADDLLAFARMLLHGGAGAVGRCRPGDDHRPADPGAEGTWRPGPRLLRRPVVGVLPVGAGQRRLRLGRRPRLIMAGGPELRPGRDRADAAHVRLAANAAGAPRHPGCRLPGARLSSGSRQPASCWPKKLKIFSQPSIAACGWYIGA